MKSLIDLKIEFHKDTGMYADGDVTIYVNHRQEFNAWCVQKLLDETKPTCLTCVHWDDRINDDKRKCFYIKGIEICPIQFIHIGSNFDQSFSVFTHKDYGCINHKNK